MRDSHDILGRDEFAAARTACISEMFMGVPPDFQVLMDRMTVAYRAGDASACADMFTMDAQLYSPYAPPAVGRGAIEARHREWTDGGVPDKELKVLQTGGSNDFAWTLSSYSEDGGKVRGTSLAVWQREVDGNWRIRLCSLNSND